MRAALLALSLLTAACAETSNPLSPDTAPMMDADAKRPAAAPSGPVALSLAAKRWRRLPLAYRPTNDATGALVADVPQRPATVNYLYTASPSRTLTGTIRASLTISGDGTAWPNEPCGAPDTSAAVRLLIFANGEDWSGEFSRWWSNPDRVLLSGRGAFVLETPIDPARWTSVYGKRGTDAPAGWAAALRDVSYVGVTFGSCFFGHGVTADGPVRVALTRYEVG
jgi:hypothetical protein